MRREGGQERVRRGGHDINNRRKDGEIEARADVYVKSKGVYE